MLTRLSLAPLLCHQVLIKKMNYAQIESLIGPIEDKFPCMKLRLALSDKLLGIERGRYQTVEEVQKWLAAELEIFTTVTCSYVETGFLTYMQGEVRRHIDVSAELLMGKEKLFDRLRAAYLIRWGYFLAEIKGESLIVISPNGEEQANDLKTCDCEEYSKYRDCSHLALSRVFVGMRNEFDFLLSR